MPALFTKAFSERLNDCCKLKVKEVTDNEFVEQSTVYVARGGAQLMVEKESGTDKHILKIDEITKTIYKPNVNITFDSVVDAFAPNIIGVILTGMGNDGAKGMRRIKDAGGITIAEDESTTVIFGMPKAAIENGSVDYVLPSDQIAEKIIALVKERNL